MASAYTYTSAYTPAYTFKNGYHNTPIYSRNENNHDLDITSPDLTFETMHPEDPKVSFIFTFLSANYYESSTLDYQAASKEIFHRGLHQHDFFELMYVISGSLYQRIEAERHLYPAGSLCLMNRKIRHQEEFSSDYRCVFLRLPAAFMELFLQDTKHFLFDAEKKLDGQLNEQFFARNMTEQFELKKEYIDFIPVQNNEAVKEYMYTLFDRLTQQFLTPETGSSFLIRYYILKIFQELADPSHYDTIPLQIGTDAETELFNSITEELKKKNGKISRNELSAALSYNPDYMNRIVKKYSGLNLHSYCMTFSMMEAERLLTHTSLTVSEICEQLGFHNQTQFYRLFSKTYGMTPKDYRKKNL